MSPRCKAVKDDSRKHTVNLFLLLLPRRMPIELWIRREYRSQNPKKLYRNFLAFAKGYQFSSKMCQRLRDYHPENRRGSSYLRAQRISKRGEDVILTQCPAKYEKNWNWNSHTSYLCTAKLPFDYWLWKRGLRATRGTKYWGSSRYFSWKLSEATNATARSASTWRHYRRRHREGQTRTQTMQTLWCVLRKDTTGVDTARVRRRLRL